jgi:predicted dehydrogenase
MGVASRELESARRFAGEFGIDVAADNTDELFMLTDADAVVVAVSEASAIDVVPQVFVYPWLALLEKPVGINVEQAEYLCGLSQRRARTTFVALNRRQYGIMTKARSELKLINSRRLIQVSDQQDTKDAISRGGTQDFVNNWMFVNSIHVIDLIRFFGRGAITRVSSTGWTPGAEPRIVSAVVDFSSGDRATYQAIWDAPGPWSVAVTTTDGRWEMSPLENGTYQQAATHERTLIPPSPDDILFKAGILSQARAVVGAIRGEPHELVTLLDSLATMRLISSIYFPTYPEERHASY